MKMLLSLSLALTFIVSATYAQPVPDTTSRNERTGAQEAYVAAYGGAWTIRSNDKSAIPISLFKSLGSARGDDAPAFVPLRGSTGARKAADFFIQFPDMFGYRTDVDEFRVTRSSERRGFTHLDLRQFYGDVPVHGGGYTITIDPDGGFHALFGEFFPEIDLADVTPAISAAQAAEEAVTAVEVETLRSDPRAELVVYPGPGEYVLAYEVIVLASPSKDFRVMVDAHTGAILHIEDVTMHFVPAPPTAGEPDVGPGSAIRSKNSGSTVTTTGSGYVYLDNPNDGATSTEDLPRLNGSGNYLDGTYVDVYNEDTAPNRAYSSTATFQYSDTDTRFDEANAYYHVDRFAEWLPDNTGFAGLGRAIEALVHWGTDLNNARYDINGDQNIDFGDGDGVFFGDFAKENDVIYHEFSHAVLHHLGTDTDDNETGALHEGTADYLAASFTGGSRMGEWLAFCTDTGDLRRVDNSSTYFHYSNFDQVRYAFCDAWPGDYLNPYQSNHANGMIWSGGLWEIRSQVGQATTDNLVIVAFDQLGTTPTFAQARDAMVSADNTFNGGANECTIRNAFGNRGIGSACPPVPNAPANLVISGNLGEWPAISWDITTYASWYNVYRCSNNVYTCTAYELIGTTSNTFYIDQSKTIDDQCSYSGWINDVTHYYVTAENISGASGSSNSDDTCTTAGKQGLAHEPIVPEEFHLHVNFPNPFNPSTEIRFDLPEAVHVRLVVYDATGREIDRLIDGPMDGGFQHVTWNASNMPSGVYVYRLDAGDFSQTQRMVLLK